MAKNVIPSTPQKRERKSTAGSDTGQPKAPFKQTPSDPRKQKMWGWALVFLSLYMLGAFVWYLFTGAADQSVVDSAFTTKLRISSRETQNGMGFFGLLLSHFFIFRWFGIAALGFPFLLFLIGFKIAQKRELLPLQRTTQLTLVYIFLLSLFFGFLVLKTDSVRSMSFLCGGIGYEINSLMDHYIGWGSFFVVLGGFGTVLVYFHGINSFDELADRFENPIKRRARPVDLEVVSEEDKYPEPILEEEDEEVMAPAVALPKKETVTVEAEIAITIEYNGNLPNGKEESKTVSGSLKINI